MYRRLQTVIHKNMNAMYTAGTDLKYGMLVEVDHKTKTVKKPTAGAKNVFLVGKERIAEGVESIVANRSDYDEIFENIKQGEYVVLEELIAGEFYATDNIANGLAVGDKLKVKADGTLEKDATGDSAIAEYVGEYLDAGHKLSSIQIIK